MSNLQLWDIVDKTDPKYTKDFKGKGGFSGTAVCAQSQRKKATEMFGLYGSKWGVTDETYEILQLSEDQHNSLLVYKAIFFYEYGDNQGNFPIVADIDLWSYSAKYKSWSKTTDPHKKVRTDALTKGLSELGFNADIFMGDFGDNKYIKPVEPTKPVIKINFEAMKKEVSALKTEEEVKNYFVKLGASPDRKSWTSEQIKDMTDIKAFHLTRVTFRGEEQ